MMLAGQNPVEAYAWLTLAKARKSVEARSPRRSMTPEQVAESKMVAAKLRAQLRKQAKRTRGPQRRLEHYVGS
jgi:hypothetical protein